MTNKVSDFYITLKLENVEGEPVRANSVSDLKVKVFTSDINTFVEFSNITISDNEDRLYIDYDQLSDLKSGVICYTYSYKIDDTNFKDKYFNSTNINYTNFYLRQTTQVGKDADLSQNEILAICDRKLLEQYKELKNLIETSTPKIEIDKELKDSENPVTNKVIKQKFDDIDNKIDLFNNILDLFQKSYLKDYLKDKTELDLSEFYLQLTKLYIPSNIKIISESSVYPNYAVTDIMIEEGCEELIDSFKYFKTLINIYIPSTIKKIKGNIFYGCRNLQNIQFSGTKEQWNKLIEGIKFENVNPNARVQVKNYYADLELPK